MRVYISSSIPKQSLRRGAMISSSLFGAPLTSIKASNETFRNLPGPTLKNPVLVNCTIVKKLNPNSSRSLKLAVQATHWVQKSGLPLAASIVVLLSSTPVNAGILSGFPGIESVPGPELPKVGFLSDFNEKNQKFYAENDKRFQESPILKELLEKSKLNKEKNKQAILDKYCIRGAEWGVGDCSAEGMTPQERDDFIAAMKKKAGIE